jgi:ATP-dependent RNA helicase RhlE
VARNLKPALLKHLIKNWQMGRTLVFTRTKHGADKVVKGLMQAGIRAEAIHGNKSQNHRTRTLNAFKSATPPVLVATDIASRGIDVDDITHVINFDIPNVAETYVHRIGRTARAGASGVAVSFCDPGEERGDLKAIERLIRKPIEVKTDQPALTTTAVCHSSGHPQHREQSWGGNESRRGGEGRSSHRRGKPQSQRNAHAGQAGSKHASHQPQREGRGHAKAPKRGFLSRGRGKGRA